MACNPITLNGIALDCGNSGGLKVLYIADVLDVSLIDLAGSTIIGIIMVSGKTFKSFSFRKGNANFVSESTRDDQAGTAATTTTITAQFNAMDAEKRNDLAKLAKANVYAIAEDNNGKYHFIGYDSYCAGSVSANTGALLTESNNYVLTLVSETPEVPVFVESSVITTII